MTGNNLYRRKMKNIYKVKFYCSKCLIEKFWDVEMGKRCRREWMLDRLDGFKCDKCKEILEQCREKSDA